MKTYRYISFFIIFFHILVSGSSGSVVLNLHDEISQIILKLFKGPFAECHFINLEDASLQGFDPKRVKSHLFQNLNENLSRTLQNLELSSHPNQSEFNSVNFFPLRGINHCSLLLVSLFEKNSPEVISNLLKRLIPKISKKDQDYFLFATDKSEKDIYKIDFLEKVKYKIILKDGYPRIGETYALCFFCQRIDQNPKIPIELIKNSEINIRINEIFPDFIENLKGGLLRITSPVRIVSFIELEFYGGKPRMKRGIHKTLVHQMQAIYNFTYTVFPSTGGGGTGVIIKNGSWIGTTSDLIHDRAEIALNTGQTYTRHIYIGYIRQIIYYQILFIVGRPRILYSWESIFWPLSPDYWLSSIFTILVIIAFFTFLTKNTGPSIFYVVSTVLEQNAPNMSIFKSRPVRFLIIAWLIYQIIFSVSYKSKLITFLAFPMLGRTPETFEELVNSNYKWGLESSGIGGSIYQHFQQSESPVERKLFDGLIYEPDPVKCLLRGTYEDFSCVVYDKHALYDFYRNFSSRSRKNPLVFSKEVTFTPHVTGWAIQKRSVFKDNFDKTFRDLWDAGLIDHWLEVDYEAQRAKRIKWEQETKTKPLIDESIFYIGPKSLVLQNFKGLFYIFAVLTCISSFVFIVENSQLKQFIITRICYIIPISFQVFH